MSNISSSRSCLNSTHDSIALNLDTTIEPLDLCTEQYLEKIEIVTSHVFNRYQTMYPSESSKEIITKECLKTCYLLKQKNPRFPK